jgi:hypothetical protein
VIAATITCRQGAGFLLYLKMSAQQVERPVILYREMDIAIGILALAGRRAPDPERQLTYVYLFGDEANIQISRHRPGLFQWGGSNRALSNLLFSTASASSGSGFVDCRSGAAAAAERRRFRLNHIVALLQTDAAGPDAVHAVRAIAHPVNQLAVGKQPVTYARHAYPVTMPNWTTNTRIRDSSCCSIF